jgi:BirA family transcriptional regulator, biotin operon repressor / biotin---[acetyl-CoA-carboxylase] ligase
MPEALPEELRRALDGAASRRGRFGEPAVFFAEAASTNDIAAGMAERGAPEGSLVVAHAQTAGRGRLGRTWFSPPGAGLYVSLVIRDARIAPVLTLAGGVAVAEGIRRATGLPVLIKWPNDIVVAEGGARSGFRKLAGILAEASSAAGVLHYVILGIGLNMQAAAYPPGIAARATSLEGELGRPVDAGGVLAEILAALAEVAGEAAAGRTDAVLDRWRALAPSASGSRVEWVSGAATCRGTTTGIDADGALLVDTGVRTERILSGELTWL